MIAQPVLWVDSRHGMYIPQAFVESTIGSAIENVSEETLDALKMGPDMEHYYDAWSTLLDNAVIRETNFNSRDVLYFVHQDDMGDVWLIPQDMVWNEENEWWSYPNEEVKEEEC